MSSSTPSRVCSRRKYARRTRLSLAEYDLRANSPSTNCESILAKSFEGVVFRRKKVKSNSYSYDRLVEFYFGSACSGGRRERAGERESDEIHVCSLIFFANCPKSKIVVSVSRHRFLSLQLRIRLSLSFLLPLLYCYPSASTITYTLSRKNDDSFNNFFQPAVFLR